MAFFKRKPKTTEVPAPVPAAVPPSSEPEPTAAPVDVVSSKEVEPTTATTVSTPDAFERFNALFDQWLGWSPEMVAPTWLPAGMIRVEETRQDGTRVIRAQLPGIDPEKDVELFVSDGMLCIDAEHREEHTSDDAGFVRREVRYGAFTRVLPLGPGVTAADVRASYKDGVLEVRVPVSDAPQAKTIPISTT